MLQTFLWEKFVGGWGLWAGGREGGREGGRRVCGGLWNRDWKRELEAVGSILVLQRRSRSVERGTVSVV